MSSLPRSTRLYAIISAPRYYSVQLQQQLIIRSNTFKDKKVLRSESSLVVYSYWTVFSGLDRPLF